METQGPEKMESTRNMKLFYWLAAAAMAVSAVIEMFEKPIEWVSIAGRVSLLAALLLLVTAKPVETKAKKLLIYSLAAIAAALLVAKVLNRL